MTSFEPTLIAITDIAQFGVKRTVEALGRLCQRAKPETVCLQLRDHEMPAQDKLEVGRVLVELTQMAQQWLSVNDRLDIAALLGVRAVHLGEASVETGEARAYLKDQGMTVAISRACHSPLDAAKVDADTMVLSPVAANRKGRAALGERGVALAVAERARRTSADTACRLHALGGVTHHNVRQVLAWGVDGVAVQGAGYENARSQDALLEALALTR